MSQTRRWVKIKEFRVKDANGEIVIIERYDEHIDTTLMSGHVNRSVGRRKLQLQDGTAVNMIDDDTFQLPGSDAVLKKV